jgi:hypothetical protein
MRESAGRRLAYNFERGNRQIFYPYVLIERGMSLAMGRQRINIFREALDKAGIVGYDARQAERDFAEYFQYAIFGVNPRDLTFGKQGSNTYSGRSTRRSSGRSSGRNIGSRR